MKFLGDRKQLCMEETPFLVPLRLFPELQMMTAGQTHRLDLGIIKQISSLLLLVVQLSRAVSPAPSHWPLVTVMRDILIIPPEAIQVNMTDMPFAENCIGMAAILWMS